MDPRLDEIHAKLAAFADPRALLEGFFAFAPVGLQVFEASGRSVLTNQAFRELFGAEPPPEYNVLEDEIAAREGVLDHIKRAFAGEVVKTPAVWYDPRELRQVEIEQGNRVAIEATFFPLFGADGEVSHVAISFRDVTAERLATAEAESERDRLRAVIEQSGDGIVVSDEAGVIRIMNAAAEQQHGVSLKAVGVARWAETYGLLGLDDRPLAVSEIPLYRALRGETVENARWKVRRPDGTVRILSGSARPLRRGPEGRLAGAILTSRDETERLALEEDLRRTAHFRDQFLGLLGHDLRNPVSAITLSAQLLFRRGDLAPHHAKAVSRIASSAERIDRMLTELLDFARTRLGGAMPLDKKRMDFLETTRRVLDELEVTHANRKLELDAQGDVVAECDPVRVGQVVANLCENALRYSPDGTPVRVKLRANETSVTLEVHNEGDEIPADERREIFEPFRRGRGAPNRHAAGLGLGLYIVKQIVDAHRGTIAVDSGPGRGTTFTVEWPRAVP